MNREQQVQEAVRKAKAQTRKPKSEPAPDEPTGNGLDHDELALILLDECKLDTDVFWLIEDKLPRCNMVMVYARGGGGKTYLMTSVALGFGIGQWFAHECERGAVLICAFERPEDAEDRLAALRERYRYNGAPVGLLKLGGKVLDEATAELIIMRANELAKRTKLPVRAIVIDTVSAALGGAKEDDEGLGHLRRQGERIHAATGATVFWVHHEGKGDHMGPRGHLTLADGCTIWWHVEERENGYRVVHVVKANRGPEFVPLFAFKLVPFEAGRDKRNKIIQLCEVQLVDLQEALACPVRKRFGQDPTAPEPILGENQKIFMRGLRKLLNRHPEGVERHDLQSAFIADLNAGKAKMLKPDASASIFRQVLKRLRDRDLIHVEGDLIATT